MLAPAARADGDPGSDVLVYQNLFVAADANISIPQQVELGNLLTSADKAGFPIRVAVISQPADLGAITALWRKPAAYASFLGTELSLAYAQRLLIVMPNGFGFNWQGHSASRGLPGARQAAHRPGRDRPGHRRRDRGAGARPGLGRPARGPGQRQRSRQRGRRHAAQASHGTGNSARRTSPR